jgi:phage tail protein X
MDFYRYSYTCTHVYTHTMRRTSEVREMNPGICKMKHKGIRGIYF